MNLPDLDLKAENETIALAKPLDKPTEQTDGLDTSVVSATSADKDVMANVAYAFLLAGASACRMCKVESKSEGGVCKVDVQLDEGRVLASFGNIFDAAGCLGEKELEVLGDLKKVAAVITKWAKVSVKRRKRPASSSVLSVSRLRAGGNNVAQRAWAEAARHAAHHGEEQAIIKVLLRGANTYIAVSLYHPACKYCFNIFSVLGVVSNDTPIPISLLPEGLSPSMRGSVYYGRAEGYAEQLLCDHCGAWRFVPRSMEDALIAKDKFFCKDVPGFTCALPSHFYDKAKRAEYQGKEPKMSCLDPYMRMLPDGWRNKLKPVILDQREVFYTIEDMYRQPTTQHSIYPEKRFIFRCFQETPLDKARVILIAQDPYYNKGEANGLAFSVNEGTPIPPSLGNIFALLNEDVPEANIDIYTTNGDLTKWAQRGVLLLNSALTVKSGKPGSHSDMWRNFTKKVIEIICKFKKNKGIVFIALGKDAQEHIKDIKDIDTTKHRVITASHPSSRSRYLGAEPFAKSNIFSKTNEALKELKLEPIDWSL